MPEDKKCIKNEEICEGKQKLSIEELAQVTGGVRADWYQQIPGTSPKTLIY